MYAASVRLAAAGSVTSSYPRQPPKSPPDLLLFTHDSNRVSQIHGRLLRQLRIFADTVTLQGQKPIESPGVRRKCRARSSIHGLYGEQMITDYETVLDCRSHRQVA